MSDDILQRDKRWMTFVFMFFFGLIFTVIVGINMFNTYKYKTDYDNYEGFVTKVSIVEPYKVTEESMDRRHGQWVEEKEVIVKYRQDITVKYDNNKEKEFKDLKVDENGFSIEDKVPIYVSKIDKNDVVLNPSVMSNNECLVFTIICASFWTIYVWVCIQKLKTLFAM